MLMMGRKRERRERVFVVLEGIKTCREKTGVAPLKWALDGVVDPKDDLLVLIILNPKKFAVESSSDGGFCCMWDHRQSLPSRRDQYIKFLHQQISQRRETYKQILRPFYYKCKSNGVNFQAKVAAGFQPMGIMLEAANNAKATWIVMDRCFAEDQIHPLNGIDCSVALVNDDEEAVIHNHYSPLHDVCETSTATEAKPNPKSPKLAKVSVLEEEPHIRYSLPVVKGEPRPLPLSPLKEEPEKKSTKANDLLRLPLKLSWEEIEEITDGFPQQSCICQHKKFEIYRGYLSETRIHVMVKRFTGDYNGIIETEKRVALSIFHQNIMGLISYHESENAAALVYPFAKNGTLDQYICDSRRKQVGLSFRDRMRIAMEIGRAVRYLHEECLQGPVVHGDLQPSNIFLRYDFRPQISGFGRAVWLQLDQTVSGQSDNRCWNKDPTDHESLALVKSDVFSFGVLLLRLFCRRSLPEDDKQLIEWARPLLLKGVFHELLDQDMEDLDMYEIYRVMSAATKCTKTNPLYRPEMSQVVSILRGENSCSMQTSPSLDGSVERERSREERHEIDNEILSL